MGHDIQGQKWIASRREAVLQISDWKNKTTQD
jgi:hypothetical protein